MKRQAEINRFAIFLFCSLVPLGSLAPITISEDDKPTTGQKHSTTGIKTVAAVIKDQVTDLFKSYNACLSVTPETVSWLIADPQAEDLVKGIPECPAFDTNCCALHAFYNLLQNLRSKMESVCGKNFTQLVDAIINQLNITLRDQKVLYTCKDVGLPQMDPSQVQEVKTTEVTTYIWQVLQKYERLMQNTAKMYS